MTPYEILSASTNFLITGLSPNKDKYAFKIYSTLLKHHKHVAGVNPNYSSSDGLMLYPTIEAVDESFDICVMVVNPRIGITMLEALKEKSINVLWFQPGSTDATILEKATAMGFEIIEACVLAVYALHAS